MNKRKATFSLKYTTVYIIQTMFYATKPVFAISPCFTQDSLVFVGNF